MLHRATKLPPPVTPNVPQLLTPPRVSANTAPANKNQNVTPPRVTQKLTETLPPTSSKVTSPRVWKSKKTKQNKSVRIAPRTIHEKYNIYNNIPTPKNKRLSPHHPSKTTKPTPILPRPRLAPWRNDPQLNHSCAQAAAQLAINEYTSAAYAFHMYNPETGGKETFDSLMKKDPTKWGSAMSKELGRLAQGVGERMKTGRDNIFYIGKSQTPSGRKITYGTMVCDYRPLKDDPWRVRLTVGGDKLPYYSDAGSPAASLIAAKLLINSVISKPKTKVATAGIKDYFLCSPMKTYEYMKLPLGIILEDIRQQYGLYNLVETDRYVYIEIRKGMHGLKQAARLAFDNLVKLLAPHGYHPIKTSREYRNT